MKIIQTLIILWSVSLLSCSKQRLVDQPFICVIKEGEHKANDRSQRTRRISDAVVSWSVTADYSWIETYPIEDWREQHAWNKLVGIAENVPLNILSFQNPSVSQSAMFGWRYMSYEASKTYGWGPLETLQLCAYSHHDSIAPWEETLIGAISPGQVLDLAIERVSSGEENFYRFYVNDKQVAQHTRGTKEKIGAAWTFGPWHGGIKEAQHDHFFMITHRQESSTRERYSDQNLFLDSGQNPFLDSDSDFFLESHVVWDTTGVGVVHW